MPIGTLPTTSAHTSLIPKADLIDSYSGQVDKSYKRKAKMAKFFGSAKQVLRGTDTRIVRRFGPSTLQKVVSGVRPEANRSATGKASVEVDTVILARANEGLLDKIQSDINVIMELGSEHGEALARFEDEAYFIKCIKGAQLAAPTGLSNFFAGNQVTLAAANDENDADKLYKAIETIVKTLKKRDQDPMDYGIFLPVDQYHTLLAHSKIMDRDFSGTAAGNVAQGRVPSLFGMAVMETNSIPSAVNASHLLGSAYNVAAKDAKAVAVIVSPKSQLVAEAISITKRVFYSEVELQWFVDAYFAFGTNARRPDMNCAIFKA